MGFRFAFLFYPLLPDLITVRITWKPYEVSDIGLVMNTASILYKYPVLHSHLSSTAPTDFGVKDEVHHGHVAYILQGCTCLVLGKKNYHTSLCDFVVKSWHAHTCKCIQAILGPAGCSRFTESEVHMQPALFLMCD